MGAAAAVMVVSLAALIWAGPTELARWLVSPRVLLVFLVLNLALGSFRLWAVLDASRGSSGPVAGLVAIVVIGTVVFPHGAVAWGQLRTYRFLNSVFVAPTSPTTTATTATAPPTSATSSSTTTTSPTTTTTTHPWEGKDRLNILLLGGDSGPGRTGVRTDTVILASVGIHTGDVALFGFPRNLTGLRFADGSEFTAYQGILNEVYLYGRDHPDRFPGHDPGAEAIEQVIEELSGLEIDHFVLVDLLAFVEAVDALGGVTLYVPKPVSDPRYPHQNGTTVTIHIPQGVQTLDGTHALAYVRIRRYSDDYDRMARQRCFLAAVAAQLDPVRVIRALPALLDTLEEHVTTDIPLERVPDLVELAASTRVADALSVTFGPPDWNAGFSSRGFPIPDTEKIREAVSLAVTDPAAARVTYRLEETGESCGYGDDPTQPPPETTTTPPSSSP
jgi:LCP family protein required for cell wall assembly